MPSDFTGLIHLPEFPKNSKINAWLSVQGRLKAWHILLSSAVLFTHIEECPIQTDEDEKIIILSTDFQKISQTCSIRL